MVGRRTQRLPCHLHTKLGPVKRRWQHPHLLSTHLPKWHVRSSYILGKPHPKPGLPSDAIGVRSQPDF